MICHITLFFFVKFYANLHLYKVKIVCLHTNVILSVYRCKSVHLYTCMSVLMKIYADLLLRARVTKMHHSQQNLLANWTTCKMDHENVPLCEWTALEMNRFRNEPLSEWTAFGMNSFRNEPLREWTALEVDQLSFWFLREWSAMNELLGKWTVWKMGHNKNAAI